MNLRLVRLTFQNGTEIVGLIPVHPDDADALAAVQEEVEVVFSDIVSVSEHATVRSVMSYIRAHELGPLH